MAHPILMPKAGQSMEEGRVVSWLVSEGDRVERGDPLVEIETDKANLEVEALASGTLLKTLAAEGDMCPVLTVIGVIGEPDEEVDIEALKSSAAQAAAEAAPPTERSDPPPPSAASRPSPSATQRAPRGEAVPSSAAVSPRGARNGGSSSASPAPRAAPVPGRRGVAASPLARRVARERHVDLAGLHGTGPGGRILRRDVENAPTRPAGVGGTGGIDWSALQRVVSYPPPSPPLPARVAVEGMRRAIAKALEHSKQTIPHFYETITADVTDALTAISDFEARGIKMSLNDVVVRACACALRDEPGMNCRVFPDHIEYPGEVNIGIAVGTDAGLVVPVVCGAASIGWFELIDATREVISSARDGKLIGSGKGTFTISNLGMFGVESFSAIINPPEGAILAVGTARAELVPLNGGCVPRARMSVTVSCDHRAIDGILAARFLQRLRHLLENPAQLDS